MRVASPPAKSLMIFDGQCGFCRRWIERWKSKTGDRIHYRPCQEIHELPEIPRGRFEESVYLIEPDGAVYSGAEAVLRSLGRQSWYRLPGVAAISERAYRFVARYRQFFSK